MLTDEQERRRMAYASLVKGQQMLLTVEMGIDNLYLQLKGVTLPAATQKRGPGAPLWERTPAQFQKVALPTKSLDLFGKLAFCEEQLLQLARRTQKLTWTEEVALGGEGAPATPTLQPRGADPHHPNADHREGEGCPGILRH